MSYVVTYHDFGGSALEGSTPIFAVLCDNKNTAKQLAKEIDAKAERLGLEALAHVTELQPVGDISVEGLFADYDDLEDEDDD